MSDRHDPLCPLRTPPMGVCQCRRIAMVRADERERAVELRPLHVEVRAWRDDLRARVQALREREFDPWNWDEVVDIVQALLDGGDQ